ncbi:MAG: hypothetical protein N3D73_01215 [Candidatus Diapherotrites archaeon]|nr:hypothetical protein [Candidatus Diapherotrites archaeon]
MLKKRMEPAQRTVSKEFMRIAKETGRIPMEYRPQIIKKIKEMAERKENLTVGQKKFLRKMGRQLSLSAYISPAVMPKVEKILSRGDKNSAKLAAMLLTRIKNAREYFERYNFSGRGVTKAQIRKMEDEERKMERFLDFLELTEKKQGKNIIKGGFTSKN